MLVKKQGDEVVVQLPVEYYRQRKEISCWHAAAENSGRAPPDNDLPGRHGQGLARPEDSAKKSEHTETALCLRE